MGMVSGEKPKPSQTQPLTDWDAKNRSQLVGGRSHDAAQLVVACVNSGKPPAEILALYRELLNGILEISAEVK